MQIDGGDGATARADFQNVHDAFPNGNAALETADMVQGLDCELAILDQAAFRGRATHVESDEF